MDGGSIYAWGPKDEDIPAYVEDNRTLRSTVSKTSPDSRRHASPTVNRHVAEQAQLATGNKVWKTIRNLPGSIQQSKIDKLWFFVMGINIALLIFQVVKSNYFPCEMPVYVTILTWTLNGLLFLSTILQMRQIMNRIHSAPPATI